ncbi:MAG: type II secretion system major pseudopilin GspG [Alphaproteobacteria bacterium]
MREDNRDEQGFTLLEMLVVLALLALVAGFAAPRVIGLFAKAKGDVALVQVEMLAGALDHYRLDVGTYPSDEQGLAALVAKPGDAPRWNGPYLQGSEVPMDPWGRPYRYRVVDEPGRGFEIVSLGADGAEGGDGDDADIRSK